MGIFETFVNLGKKNKKQSLVWFTHTFTHSALPFWTQTCRASCQSFPGQGCDTSGAYAGNSACFTGIRPGCDTTLSQDTVSHPPTHSHTGTMWYVFGRSEETEEPEGNPCTHTESPELKTEPET